MTVWQWLAAALLSAVMFLAGSLLTAERDRQVLGERLARVEEATKRLEGIERKLDHVVLTIGPPAPPRRGDE